MVALLTRHPDAVVTERTEPRTYREFPAAFDVVVTRDDIKEGLCGQATKCAVALAGYRALGLDPDSNYITVCDGEMTVWNGAGYAVYDLGPGAVDWIERFDLRGIQGLALAAVRPVTFRSVKVEVRRDE